MDIILNNHSDRKGKTMIHPTKYTASNQQGIINGEPMDVYHQADAVGNSKLWTFHKRRREYEAKYRYQDKQEKAEAQHFKMGRALHTAVLEPHEWDNEYTLVPELNFRGKDAKAEAIIRLNQSLTEPLPEDQLPDPALKKEEIEAFFAQYPGKVYLTQDEIEQINAAKCALNENEITQEFLQAEGCQEITFRTKKTKYGFPLQCRPDKLIEKPDELIIVDLKSIADMSRWRTHRMEMGYYRLANFYNRVVQTVTGWDGPIRHLLLVVELRTDITPSVAVKTFGPDTYAAAGVEIDKDLAELSKAIEADDYREPYELQIETEEIPDWKQRAILEEVV